MDSRSCAMTPTPPSHPVCEFVMHEGLFAMFAHCAWAKNTHPIWNRTCAPRASTSDRGVCQLRCWTERRARHGDLSVETETRRWIDFARGHYSDIEPNQTRTLRKARRASAWSAGKLRPPGLIHLPLHFATSRRYARR